MIVGAATAQSWSWAGTLDALGAVEPPAASAGAPGLLVIGAVVGLGAELAAALSSELSSPPGAGPLSSPVKADGAP